MVTHNALKSLHGDGPKNSYVADAHGVKGGVERPQTIYTPPCIIDRLLAFWPAGIAMDPCAGAMENVPADQWVSEDPPGKYWLEDRCGAVSLDDSGGLGVQWPRRTYVNPPYKHLKKWLPKIATAWECVALVPVRPHRKWWRAAVLDLKVLYLDPLKFVGYTQAFPAPLCLLYTGARRSEFAETFGDLGGFI